MASSSLLVSEHENVLTVQDEPLYEIVNGQRVDMPPMSAYATWLASRLHLRLGLYAEDKGLGVSVTEMLFVLDAEHNLRRRPDVAFVSMARWPLDKTLPETGDWDEDQSEDLVQGLNSLSLLQSLDLRTRTLRLHDNMIWYLRDRIGQSFEGIITAVVEFGMFVQLLEAAADGLLHLTALRDDDYEMEASQTAWVGRRTKRRFALGTHVRVVLTAVNPVEGLIDLELADTVYR